MVVEVLDHHGGGLGRVEQVRNGLNDGLMKGGSRIFVCTGYGANSCTVLLMTLGSSKVAYIGVVFQYIIWYYPSQAKK